jgi:hypothetical protein
MRKRQVISEPALIRLNRELAESFFGRRQGRPTISTRAGRAIAQGMGISPRRGKGVFHAIASAGIARLVTSRWPTTVTALVGLATFAFLESLDPS